MKGIYLRRLTTESDFISNDLRMNKKLNVTPQRTIFMSMNSNEV